MHRTSPSCAASESDQRPKREGFAGVKPVKRVAYRIGQLALRADLTEPGFQIVVQIIDDDARVLVADCATMVGVDAANLAVDGI